MRLMCSLVPQWRQGDQPPSPLVAPGVRARGRGRGRVRVKVRVKVRFGLGLGLG